MIKKLIILFVYLGGVVGCTSTQQLDQSAVEQFFTLSTGDSLGQTFVAHYDGLDSISLVLHPPENSEGSLTLHIRETPQDLDDIRTVEVPFKNITAIGNYTFRYPPIKDSNGNSYYMYLTQDSQGIVSVGTTSPEKYLDGSLYLNDIPEDAQLVFGLTYDNVPAALGILVEFTIWMKYILIAAFLYILPGFILLRMLLPAHITLTWIEKIALASGISLAIYPLFYLWTDVIGLRLGLLIAWGPPLMSLIILLWQARLLRAKDALENLKTRFRQFASIENITLVSILIILTFTRFWSVRSMVMPMWGDSYQHTMIAQLLVDNNGLFRSWLPYAEMTTFTYHFGFHSLVAGFHYLSKLSLPLSVLWTGQILNILAVISIVPLAMRIHRSLWSASFSLVFAGLLFNMPMFYTNWGRYTQLTGQVILPAIVLLAWYLLESKKVGWKIYLSLWIVLCGLALTHYRVLIFAFGALIALYIIHLRKSDYLVSTLKILITGSGAFALFLPWFINVLSGKLPTIVMNNVIRSSSMLSTPNQLNEPIGELTTYLPSSAWIGLLFVIFWGIRKRNRCVAMLTIWIMVVYFLANPHLLRIPGTRLITNFAVFIAAYIPAGIFLGGFLGWFTEKIFTINLTLPIINTHFYFRILIASLVIFFALWGINLRSHDIDQTAFALATVPDLKAAEWIKNNTPPVAKFVVNSFYVNHYGAIVGSDGGWWLPILANRETNVPPLNYTAEQGTRPDYRLWINGLTDQILSASFNSQEVIRALRERGVTHIYIGQRQGSVNSPGPLLPPSDLLSNSQFRPIYHQDLVWIFEILD